MIRGFIGTLGLAVVLVVTGCSEPQEQSGNTPDLKVAPPSTACNPDEFNGHIVGYFPGGLQNSIKALKDAMLNTPASDPARRALGYEIMDSIGRWSRNGTTLSATALAAGSSLTKAVIKCIYTASVTAEFPGFPDAVLYSFDRALNAPAGGAYFVRPQADPTTDSAVVGKTALEGTLSGIEPPEGSSWGDILGERTLIYGWLETTDVFEWALIRPNATFDPAAIVAICSASAVPTNTLVEESNIGFLTWAGYGNTICGATQSTTMLESGWGLGGLASRLARWGTGLVTPRPLYAAMTSTVGGTGTVRTLKSRLSLGEVDGIKLSLVSGPKPVEHKNVAFDVQVFAFTLVGTDSVGVNNICTRVTAFNQNGQPVVLQGPKACGATNNNQLAALTETTDIGGKPKAGYVTLTVTVPTTGALKLAIDAVPIDNVDDNLETTVTGTSTGRFNVKP
jgi:hypothetical protein